MDDSPSFLQDSFYQTLSASQPTLESRISVLSAALLGAPYLGGSLGEGEQGKYDKDPLTRFDGFDCTTYIETVLAGALSKSVYGFRPQLMALRYKNSDVSFVTRNHFPSLDWVPNNRDKFDDMTMFVAGNSVEIASTTIDKPAWYKKINSKVVTCEQGADYCAALLTQLHEEGDAFIPELATLDYVPLTALYLDGTTINQALLDRIATGSLINIVRPDWSLKKWIGTNMNVSHQGIAIRKDGELFLRHSSVVYKKVIDERFIEYFSRYTNTSSLKGFNVQTLKNQ